MLRDRSGELAELISEHQADIDGVQAEVDAINAPAADKPPAEETNAAFPSQLLSQILAVGSLFSAQSLLGRNQEEESKGGEDDELTPEEVSRELLEECLKRRIFLSDRLERLERGLVRLSLLPTADTGLTYCDDRTLGVFRGCLRADDGLLLHRLLQDALQEPDQWFEVYRSVSGGPQGGGDTEEDKRRQRKVERKRNKIA